MPPARFLAPLATSESSILPPLGIKQNPSQRPATSSMNTTERAVHRATQKGYTAGRMPVYEPKIKTPANVGAWCDSVRDANQLMTAGSCSGWLGGNRSWRSYLNYPNDNLPGVPARPPKEWTSQYSRDFSPSRRPPIQTPTRRIVGYSKWVDARKDFNESFDKITTVKGPSREDSVMRPFMSTMGGKEPLAREPRFQTQHAGKDTAESAAWDGSMGFDSVYSQKHVLKDTASSVALAG
eukprot:CAMPEP_0197618222 /NCGR_PEP_ID=MMETSP1326-20131121/61429_1 /TAXON_ID=1155430 /ORGANISM="Genus nov. species nov., Strain RCC2288" /LENGTH=237 /DNA_ID=CAMNT_0043187121 /DNA_START=284 /DNA_END=997 /DNA_ORIENTATION=+